MLLLLVIGDILGAGIYVLVGELAAQVGPMLWLAFAGAFVIALASAVSYAELVTRFPGAAGSALYARRAFGSPTMTALVGIAVLASTLSTSATTARAFAGDYLSELVEVPTSPVAVLVVIVLTAIAALGVEASARANATLTLVEASGLVLVITIGVVVITGGEAEVGSVWQPSTLQAGAYLNAVALAFFAFLGFEDAVHLSEEVDNPRRTFPLVLLGAVLVAGVIYLLVAVTTGAVVDPAVLAASDGPLLEVVKAGNVAVSDQVFALIALGAVTNTSLFALVSAARLLFGMGRDGDLPAVLGRVSARRGSPVVAVVVSGALAAVLAATGAVGPLARTAVTALLFVLFIVNVAAIKTRSEPQGWRPPQWVAFAGAVTTGSLFLHQLLTADGSGLLRLGALVGLGLLVRLLARFGRREPATAD